MKMEKSAERPRQKEKQSTEREAMHGSREFDKAGTYGATAE
jgi:hypothetical protein